MAGLYLGMARGRMGPAAAVLDGRRGAVGACEENRLTRARVATPGRPDLAIAELLEFLHLDLDDVTSVSVVTGAHQREWPQETSALAVDAGLAHAAYAFRASPFAEALVLVCDVHSPRGWAAWRFSRTRPPEPVGDALGAYPLARIYGELTDALGFIRARDEHLVEALARTGRDTPSRITDHLTSTSEGVGITSGFADAIRQLVATSPGEAKHVAASVQRRLGECLAELLIRLAGLGPPTPEPRALCVSGGLFFNTYFTTVAATCGAFARVHVPAHPGRNGAAMGAALVAGADGEIASAEVGSPYLGPAYTSTHIKEDLDNCKLSYDLLHDERLLDEVVRALAGGRLIGWFHDRLEWGPRALGHRSVLADPLAPHTLDNLNGFLKRRPAYRSYGVSVPLAAVHEWFEGPTESPFMQFEYRPRDPERFRMILPPGVARLRVHTVDEREPRFLRLLTLWGEKTGTPVLVNTSFNGFHEPLVCSPRDAIRVFYGTGLDMVALENFVLHK